MKQYVCPQCGSQYIKVKSGGVTSVFKVSSDFTVEFMQNASGLQEEEIAKDSAVLCAACSWKGRLLELQETDHLL